MKKIPCLFQRDFRPRPKGRGQEAILRSDITPGCEQALAIGVPTIKWDGTACAVIKQSAETTMPWVPLPLRSEMHLFKRYDTKKGKPAPENGIPCDEPDPTTGHWPHWIPVGEGPDDRWLREAYLRLHEPLVVGSYEFCGPHVQGNPQALREDRFILHGADPIDGLERTFEGIKAYLETHKIEGIVFWVADRLASEPRAKIRRKDYDLPWPPRNEP